MYELINGTPMPIREYNGQRVVTFRDIDTVHQRPDGTARRNFNKNRKHFIEGDDFFVRNSYEAKKDFGITAPNGLILITEYGYMMLVKSFEDDLSWDVQRQLVNSYFRVREQAPIIPYADTLLLLHQKQTELESLVNSLENLVTSFKDEYESRMEKLERRVSGEDLTARDITAFNSLVQMFASPTCKLTIGVETEQEKAKQNKKERFNT